MPPLPFGTRMAGRSPRERGSRAGGRYVSGRSGSIPAGAGEPGGAGAGGGCAGVDPRGSGGAVPPLPFGTRMAGRSPRERGSQGRPVINKDRKRSIPAGAGEPGSGSARGRGARVDPRGSGGARSARWSGGWWWGRSPRERGSRGRNRRSRHSSRSIPAGAGEPSDGQPCDGPARVDPRGSGGARLPGFVTCAIVGRSPRERGSLRISAHFACDPGSIPAGAGEPARRQIHAGAVQVDPRGSGGASITTPPLPVRAGRSPRERGSPLSGAAAGPGRGSIPAGAGEPTSCAGRRWRYGVDPRGSGGAGCGCWRPRV